MDEMEFTEAESNMNDLISEYQQYQVPILPKVINLVYLHIFVITNIFGCLPKTQILIVIAL
jgi:hypothetical protein